MDTSRISFGEMIAGVSGLVLFIVMFLPWYGLSVDIVDADANAWESFDFIDILLFLVAVIAVAATVARAAGVVLDGLPAPVGQIVAAAGALAVLLILYRLIDPPNAVEGVDVSRKVGIFLGLLAAAGVTYGGYTAMNERASGTAPTGRPPPA